MVFQARILQLHIKIGTKLTFIPAFFSVIAGKSGLQYFQSLQDAAIFLCGCCALKLLILRQLFENVVVKVASF